MRILLVRLRTIYYTCLYITLAICLWIIQAEYYGQIDFQGVGLTSKEVYTEAKNLETDYLVQLTDKKGKKR